MPRNQAARCHALSHTTISPNVVHGGQKTNMIPDTVDIDVDIRTLARVTAADVDEMLDDLPGELRDHVVVGGTHEGSNRASTESSIGNPLWDAVRSATQVV